MKDINKFIQNHNTLTLATERNHEVFAAALFYVPVDNCKALIFVSNPKSEHIKNLEYNAKCAATIQKNNLGTCPDGWKYTGRGYCETSNNQCGKKLFFGNFSDVDKLNWAVRCNSTWSNEKQLSSTEYAPSYTLNSIMSRGV